MSKYPDGSHRFSPSELSTFRSCRRKWMLGYFMSLRKKVREARYPMTVGNLVHAALEVFYLNGGIHSPDSQELAEQHLRELRASDLEECAAEDNAVIVKAHKSAEACLHSYLHWVDQSGADINLRIIGSEDKLSMDGIFPNARLNGRIDLLAEDVVTGDIVVIDFKLVGSITDKIRTLNLDQQAKAYALLAREKYGKAVRVAFRLVKINARTAAVKGPQEEEYTIVLNGPQLDTYRTQLRGMMGDIIDLSDKLEAGGNHQELAYPSPSDTCSWACDFFATCPMIDDPLSDSEWLLNNAYESKFTPAPDHETETSVTVVKKETIPSRQTQEVSPE